MVKKKSYNSRFNKLVRIADKQLDWLKENKDCRTMAGYLDKLINQQKKYMKYEKMKQRRQEKLKNRVN